MTNLFNNSFLNLETKAFYSYSEYTPQINCCRPRGFDIGPQGEEGTIGPTGAYGYIGPTGTVVGPQGPKGLGCTGWTGPIGPTASESSLMLSSEFILTPQPNLIPYMLCLRSTGEPLNEITLKGTQLVTALASSLQKTGYIDVGVFRGAIGL
jgi:hypothetical protein